MASARPAGPSWAWPSLWSVMRRSASQQLSLWPLRGPVWAGEGTRVTRWRTLFSGNRPCGTALSLPSLSLPPRAQGRGRMWSSLKIQGMRREASAPKDERVKWTRGHETPMSSVDFEASLPVMGLDQMHNLSQSFLSFRHSRTLLWLCT